MQPRVRVGLAELRQPHVGPWLVRVAFEWSVLVLAVLAARAVDHWVAYAAAVFVVGTRQHGLALLGHDGAHRLVCRSRGWNDLLTGVLCFWPLGIGIAGYRRHHFAHHRHTGGPLDPELEYKHSHARPWRLPLRLGALGYLVVKDVLGLSLIELFDVLRIARHAGWRDLVGPVVVWSGAAVVLAALGAWWMLLLWVAGLCTSFWAMFRLRALTEHHGTADTHRIAASWWQRLVFLPHNTWCHWEHHRWPSIPCWNLPRARGLARAEPVRTVSTLLSGYHGAAAAAGNPTPPRRLEPRACREASSSTAWVLDSPHDPR